jgi:hypothetical protein
MLSGVGRGEEALELVDAASSVVVVEVGVLGLGEEFSVEFLHAKRRAWRRRGGGVAEEAECCRRRRGSGGRRFRTSSCRSCRPTRARRGRFGGEAGVLLVVAVVALPWRRPRSAGVAHWRKRPRASG